AKGQAARLGPVDLAKALRDPKSFEAHGEEIKAIVDAMIERLPLGVERTGQVRDALADACSVVAGARKANETDLVLVSFQTLIDRPIHKASAIDITRDAVS